MEGGEHAGYGHSYPPGYESYDPYAAAAAVDPYAAYYYGAYTAGL
jgi:hypothetical protein